MESESVDTRLTDRIATLVKEIDERTWLLSWLRELKGQRDVINHYGQRIAFLERREDQ